MTDTATEGLQPRAKYFVYFIVLVALLAASVSTYVIIDNTKKTNEAFSNANVCINQYPNNLHGSEEDEKSIDFVSSLIALFAMNAKSQRAQALSQSQVCANIHSFYVTVDKEGKNYLLDIPEDINKAQPIINCFFDAFHFSDEEKALVKGLQEAQKDDSEKTTVTNKKGDKKAEWVYDSQDGKARLKASFNIKNSLSDI